MIGAFVVEVALTILVWHRTGPIAFDRVLLHGYVPQDHFLVYRVASVATELGSPAGVIIVAIVASFTVWRLRRSLVDAAAIVVVPGVAGVVESTAKLVVGRTRPLTAFLTGESGVGFPSGHATGFAALALTLAIVITNTSPRSRRVTAVVIAVVLSVLVGVSRVIVGAHYPSDVIAGVLLGLAIAELMRLLVPHVVALAVSRIPALERMTR